MSLDADFRVRRGNFELDLELAVEDGEVVALLGPNGAGKSTALRALAGLVPIDHGYIALGSGADRVVLDRVAEGGDVFVEPERRQVGMVFQDHLLFGHLTALQNVAFGLRAAGNSRRAASAEARAALDRLGIADLAAQRSTTLSGGQAQRVALARAIVTNPRMLLLDEPLAALDVGTRNEVRRELRRVLGSTEGVRVLVTHDPVDAHVLADRVVVIEEGRVVQEGTIAEVTAHPRSRYVADLAGVNLVEGELRAGVVNAAGGSSIFVAPDESVGDGPVLVAVAPTAIALHRSQPSGSPRNVWRGVVSDLDHREGRVRVSLAPPVGLVAEITTEAMADLALEVGQTVWAAAKATEVKVYPA